MIIAQSLHSVRFTDTNVCLYNNREVDTMKNIVYALNYPGKALEQAYYHNTTSDIPFFLIEEDLLNMMVAKDTNYFDVPGTKTKSGYTLRFMFDITILDENAEIHRYDFKGVKRI